MDGTTTVAAPETGAGAPAQPAEGAQTTAAEATQPQQSQGQPAQADQEYAAWLQSKGITPDSDAAHKAAQMAYNSEKLMTRATMEASELKKSLAPNQPAQPAQGGQVDNGMQEFIADYRRDKLISSFKESHSDWKDHEPAMVKLLSEATPSGYTRSQLVNAGVLSLEDIYTMAKLAAPDNTKQIQAQTRDEVLQALANTQRAGGGNAHASNPNPQSPNEDPINAAIRAARGSK